MDSDSDSKLSTGWFGFQICEILWIRIRFWIQFYPWVGSDYGFVFLLGFGFGFGFIFFLESESESVNPNPPTSRVVELFDIFHLEKHLFDIFVVNKNGR